MRILIWGRCGGATIMPPITVERVGRTRVMKILRVGLEFERRVGVEAVGVGAEELDLKSQRSIGQLG